VFFNGEFLLLSYTKSQIIIYNNFFLIGKFFYQGASGASRATDIFLTENCSYQSVLGITDIFLIGKSFYHSALEIRE